MNCADFFSGNAGDTFRFQVTRDNNESILTASLTEFNRTTNAIRSDTFTKSQLRLGVPVQLAAGCSYHFEILKAPSSTAIQITITDPNIPPPTVKQCTGRFLGPWILRAA